MSSWMPDAIHSHRLQLAATAVVSGCLAVSAVLGLQRAKTWYKVHDLKGSIPDENTPHDVEKINSFGGAEEHQRIDDAEHRENERSNTLARRARLGDYDNDLILEQLARNRVFLSDAGLEKLRNAFVVVVGCGGVGSHATAALTRSGCSKIRLIDFDQVTLSSLNRHAVATLADVGKPKVICLRDRLQQITPWTKFDCRNQLFSERAATEQLAAWGEDGQKPDYVIDAIDNIDSKVALLKYCHDNQLKVICSMGAGCKSDPTRVFIGDISTSTDDPLSRSTRRRLRMMGVKNGIPVVFSSEKTGPGKAQLLPLPDEEFKKGSVGELGVLPDFRIRILPVLGTMPAVFGLCVANHIMLEIAGYPHDYMQSKSRDKMYEGILAQVQGTEEKVARHHGYDALGLRIPLTADDVGYLVEEVYRGRSAISGLASRLAVVRWRKPEGNYIDTTTQGQKATTLQLDELVCMTRDEANRHEKLVLKEGQRPEDLYDQQIMELVHRRMEEEKAFRRQR